MTTRDPPKPSETRRARQRRPSHARIVPLAIAAIAAACAGPRNFDNENDALRREREALKDRIADLEARLAEADARLAERATPPAADALAALPRCAAVEIERLSGPIGPDAPEQPRAIAVYIRTVDGRRRFLQVAADLVVEAHHIPEPALDAPDTADERAAIDAARASGVLLGRVALDPEQLREAYRSGFSGPHYTIEVPPPADVRFLDGAILLSATLHDRLTGKRHHAWRVVRLPH